MTNTTLRKKTPWFIDDAELALLEKRSALYKAGKVKVYTLEEVNKKLEAQTRK